MKQLFLHPHPVERSPFTCDAVPSASMSHPFGCKALVTPGPWEVREALEGGWAIPCSQQVSDFSPSGQDRKEAEHEVTHGSRRRDTGLQIQRLPRKSRMRSWRAGLG